MKERLIPSLQCPSCRKSYQLKVEEHHDDSIETALLTCPSCLVTIPVLHGFPLFDHQFLRPPENFSEILRTLFATNDDYLAFLHLKRRKPVFDLYAAFQPFNESTQEIFPLLPLLHEIVKPGDMILDLWCRTGWTGEFLAAEFPEQDVVAVWENSSGVLGYKGFHFWLGSGKRCKNLDIVFYSPNNPLPFTDQTFAIVHGLDTLHRYRHVPLIPECLRVAKRQNVIVFPHVHLTNSEPEPFFERGETQLHGTEYSEYFRKLFQGTHRKGFVLSEKTLFETGDDYVLKDESETSHFNATVLLADQKYEGRHLARAQKELAQYENAYVILSPMCEINFATWKVTIASESMAGGAEELFYRHPIYLKRLQEKLPITLEERDCILLYWAARMKNISELSEILKVSKAEVLERLLSLEEKEIVQIQNVSRAMAKLQKYYSTQEYYDDKQTLSSLWESAISFHADRPLLIWPKDGSSFTYRDCGTVTRMAISFLRSHNVEKGDRILIDARFHPEFFFLFWASVLTGAIAVPVNPDLKHDAFAAIVSDTSPKIIFKDPNVNRIDAGNFNTFAFGIPEDSVSYKNSFSQCLADYEPVEEIPAASQDQPAVILFTSGSTGLPKGILLSHGSLFRSAQIMNDAYAWRKEDRFLGAGGYHTMSGLRNPCIAVLHSGASVVVPNEEQTENPLNFFTVAIQQQASILNVAPNFLAFWTRAAQKAKHFENHGVRMLLSTGSSLHASHRETFEKLFRISVYDYYGLTETTGACILQDARLKDKTDSGIGRPSGCITKIVDEEGEKVLSGETGELAIYGENLMLGYLGNSSLTSARVRNGWFYTGDRAQMTPAGYVHLLGRQDRMMIDKNGENVYPEEIENAIKSVSKASDVFVAQCRDDSMIERIVALVSFDSIEENTHRMSDLKSALRQILPDHHIPYFILPVKQLPRNSAGKVSMKSVQEIIRGLL